MSNVAHIGNGIAPSRAAADAWARIVPLDRIDPAGWDRLSPASADLMAHRSWITTAAESYSRHRPATALIVGSALAPRALIPLYEPEGHPVGLRQLGALDLGESVAPASFDDDALHALARGLWRLGTAVDLGHALTDTRLLRHLRATRPAAGLLAVRTKRVTALPRLHLTGAWSDPARAIGRKHRQTLARKRRQAERQFGPVRLRVLTPGPHEAADLIDRAYRVEANSWKSRAGTALMQDPRQAGFFHLLGQRAAAQGHLRLAFLDIGGQPAAMQYGIVRGGVFWSLRLGYDERYAKVSPGELLMLDLLTDCVRCGLTRFEFCGKSAGWTARWTSDARPIAAVRLYPPTADGLRVLTHELGDQIRQRGSDLLRKKEP